MSRVSGLFEDALRIDPENSQAESARSSLTTSTVTVDPEPAKCWRAPTKQPREPSPPRQLPSALREPKSRLSNHLMLRFAAYEQGHRPRRSMQTHTVTGAELDVIGRAARRWPRRRRRYV